MAIPPSFPHHDLRLSPGPSAARGASASAGAWPASLDANRQTDKQTNRQTDKQTNRQTDKQTLTYLLAYLLRPFRLPASGVLCGFSLPFPSFWASLQCQGFRLTTKPLSATSNQRNLQHCPAPPLLAMIRPEIWRRVLAVGITQQRGCNWDGHGEGISVSEHSLQGEESRKRFGTERTSSSRHCIVVQVFFCFRNRVCQHFRDYILSKRSLLDACRPQQDKLL